MAERLAGKRTGLGPLHACWPGQHCSEMPCGRMRRRGQYTGALPAARRR